MFLLQRSPLAHVTEDVRAADESPAISDVEDRAQTPDRRSTGPYVHGQETLIDVNISGPYTACCPYIGVCPRMATIAAPLRPRLHSALASML